MCLRGPVELTPGDAGTDAHPAGPGVHRELLHRPHVDDEPVVVQAHAGHRMTAGPHRDVQAPGPRQL
jgi:hypothetical protein